MLDIETRKTRLEEQLARFEASEIAKITARVTLVAEDGFEDVSDDENDQAKTLAESRGIPLEDVKALKASEETIALDNKISPIRSAISSASSHDELSAIAAQIKEILPPHLSSQKVSLKSKLDQYLKENLARIKDSSQSVTTEEELNEINDAIQRLCAGVDPLLLDLEYSSTDNDLRVLQVQISELTRTLSPIEAIQKDLSNKIVTSSTSNIEVTASFQYADKTLAEATAAAKEELAHLVGESFLGTAIYQAEVRKENNNATKAEADKQKQAAELLALLETEKDPDVFTVVNNFVSNNLITTGAVTGAGAGAATGAIFGPLGIAVGAAVGGVVGGAAGATKKYYDKYQAEKAAKAQIVTPAISEMSIKILGTLINETVMTQFLSANTIGVLDQQVALENQTNELSQRVAKKKNALATAEDANHYVDSFDNVVELRTEASLLGTDAPELKTVFTVKEKIDAFNVDVDQFTTSFNEAERSDLHLIAITDQLKTSAGAKEEEDKIHKNLLAIMNRRSRLELLQTQVSSRLATAPTLIDEAQKADYTEKGEFHNLFARQFLVKENNDLARLNSIAETQSKETVTVPQKNLSIAMVERLCNMAFYDKSPAELEAKTAAFTQAFVNINGITAKARDIQARRDEKQVSSSLGELAATVSAINPGPTNSAAAIVSDRIFTDYSSNIELPVIKNAELSELSKKIKAEDDELMEEFKRQQILKDQISQRRAELEIKEQNLKIYQDVVNSAAFRRVFPVARLKKLYSLTSERTIGKECLDEIVLQNANSLEKALPVITGIFENHARLAELRIKCESYRDHLISKDSKSNAAVNSKSLPIEELRKFNTGEFDIERPDVTLSHKFAVNRLVLNQLYQRGKAGQILMHVAELAVNEPFIMNIYGANRDLQGSNIVVSLINLIRRGARAVAGALGLSLFAPEGRGVKRKLDQVLQPEITRLIHKPISTEPLVVEHIGGSALKKRKLHATRLAPSNETPALAEVNQPQVSDGFPLAQPAAKVESRVSMQEDNAVQAVPEGELAQSYSPTLFRQNAAASTNVVPSASSRSEQAAPPSIPVHLMR